mmetsp:Transcript_49611/g.116528  ORF Transcript_49611/g.116528 Transcript_49611/m.116528 type:complete len:219 (-) Transcript_49611:504-1160(-)
MRIGRPGRQAGVGSAALGLVSRLFAGLLGGLVGGFLGRLLGRLGRLILVGLGLDGPRARHDGRNALELVLAHVLVHLAPAGVDGSLLGLGVEHVAVLDRTHRMAAGAADGLAVGLLGRRDLGRVVNAQLLAGTERGEQGQGDEKALHRFRYRRALRQLERRSRGRASDDFALNHRSAHRRQPDAPAGRPPPGHACHRPAAARSGAARPRHRPRPAPVR